MDLSNFQPRSDWGKGLLAKGRAKGKAEDILVALETRGIPIDDPTRRQIITCTDLSQLDTWFRRSITATSASELFRAG